MKSSAKSINLTSLDDLFSTEESRAEESCEKVVRIPLAELHPFPNHPFHVRDDEAMQNTVDSIKEYETFENKNGYPPMYCNTEQYNTKESIKRRIVQARAELNQLAKEL